MFSLFVRKFSLFWSSARKIISSASALLSKTSLFSRLNRLNFDFKIRFWLSGKKSSGYVLIMVACFIPVILAGVYFLEKHLKLTDVRLLRKPANDQNLEKRCAREAALAVARNWNPGLTLGQQRAAVYKVADAVYNAHPCYDKSALGKAVPGMIVRDSAGNLTQLDAGMRTVDYENLPKQIGLWNGEFHDGRGAYWNVYFGNWRESDKASDESVRYSGFDEVDEASISTAKFSLIHHDIREDPHPHLIGSCTPSDKYQQGAGQVYSYIPSRTTNANEDKYLPKAVYAGLAGGNGQSVNGKYAGQTFKYTSRLTPGDTKVQISIDDDSIKVKTDNQIAKAVPAECNVDIVLAVPVNGAACSINGGDASSETPEDPYSHTWSVQLPEDVKQTPIYQMGQALKNFVKTHFYHTMGVNMALIPYSGKLSISPERATAWTIPFPQFDSSSLHTEVMIGACLYGTSGVRGAPLSQPFKTKALVSGDALPPASVNFAACGSVNLSSDLLSTYAPYYWGGVLTGCPIMCRRGAVVKSSDYGENPYICGGFLFGENDTEVDISNDNSSSAVPYKYMRMNLNPCYVGYANQLSMRCEKACTHFLPNPYYMIEPTADLVKIYEMCNALYPVYDVHNVSNFVFAALEWANNMFQEWTRDPEIDAKNGTSNDATLARNSKLVDGRKKAVILLVNKPDWFEPHEMTYLGFNNDFSEVPTVVSDKIDFSIDYADTANQNATDEKAKRRFLDGSAYNTTYAANDSQFPGISNQVNGKPLIAGANKIIKFEKFSGTDIERKDNDRYEVENGTYRFKFPHKGLVKLVVAKGTYAEGTVTFYDTNIGDTYDVRKDSTSGDSISLNAEQTVKGAQTFVFKGGTMPVTGYSYNCLSGGANFQRNLCVKKVRYSLSNAIITNCTLKKQIVRYYGAYRNQGSLINRSGVTATYATDSCMSLNEGSDMHMGSTPIDIYGISLNFIVAGTGLNQNCEYYSNNDYTSLYSFSGDYIWGNSGVCSLTSGINSSTIRVRVGGSCFYQLYVQNQNDKTLQSHTPITVDPLTYDGLTKNQGVYLANYNNENWICFQGDGELHVTVEGGGILDSNITFTNVQGDSSQRNISETTTIFIEPSQISDTADSDGNYYIQFNANNIKLVSAEITNCKYRIIKPVSTTYNNYSIARSAGGGTMSVTSADAGSRTEPGTKSQTDTISNCSSVALGGNTASNKLTYTKTKTRRSCIVEKTREMKKTIELSSPVRLISVTHGSSDGTTYRFVAVGDIWERATYVGAVVCSDDGFNWRMGNTEGWGGASVTGSLCSDGKYRFVCIWDCSNSAYVLYSDSGYSWARTPLPGTRYDLSLVSGLCSDGKTHRFVIISRDESYETIIDYSEDGITWKSTVVPAGVNILGSVCANGLCSDGKSHRFVALGKRKAAYSNDGISWTNSTTPFPNTYWSSVTNGLCSNGKYRFVAVAGGYDPTTDAVYSDDGINWKKATLPSATIWQSVTNGLCSDGKTRRFVAVGCTYNSAIAAYSDDGITWKSATLPRNRWQSVTNGRSSDGKYRFVTVAKESMGSINNVDDRKLVAYSDDGITWSQEYPYTDTYYDTEYYDYESGGTLTFPAGSKIVITTNGSGKITYNGTQYNSGATISPSGTSMTYTLPEGTTTTKVTATYDVPTTITIPRQKKTASISNDGTLTCTADTSNLTGSSASMIACAGEGICQLTYSEKGKITFNVASTDSSGTINFTSGVTGTKSYTVTGSKTITFSRANVSSSPIKFTINGIKITNVAIEKITVTSPSKTENLCDVIVLGNGTKTGQNGVMSVSVSGSCDDLGVFTTSDANGEFQSPVRGKVLLTVAPSTTATSGSIQFKSGANTGVQPISTQTTITINASDWQREGNAFYLDFEASNLVMLSAKMTQADMFVLVPPVPKRSSVIDFSVNDNGKPRYNSDLIVYSNQIQLNGTMNANSYDSNIGFWSIPGNNDWYDMKLYAKNDFYTLSIEKATPNNYENTIYYGNGASGSFTSRGKVALPGVNQFFALGNEYYPTFGMNSDGLKLCLIYSGCTQPINTVLYHYGISNGIVNEFHVEDFIDPTLDFNRTVMRQLTANACTKLKTAKARIYVVKYRKQAKWKCVTRNGQDTYAESAVNHSYTEIDSCARESGGTVYDVTTEADLKAKLDLIAADIKNWAGYEEADLIE